MPWPGTAEFEVFLYGSGLFAANPTALQKALDLQAALNSGVERFEEKVKYWPFISTGSDTTRTYNAPRGRILDLNGGLVSLTSLVTDVTYANSAGLTRTNLQHFGLEPSDAPSNGLPYTRIEMYVRPGYYPASIQVTGKFGYCLDADLPSSARRGVMALAADELMPQITSLARKGSGLIRLTQGDSTKMWGDDAAKAAEYWDSVAQKAICQFKRDRYA